MLVSQNFRPETTFYDQSNLNKYKQCPYCGEIWFRIVGCGKMNCGGRSLSKDVVTGSYLNYFIKIINNKLVINKKEEISSSQFVESINLGVHDNIRLSNQEILENQQRTKSGKTLITPAGCGREINWDTMIDVTDKVLNQLGTIDDSDYYHNKL